MEQRVEKIRQFKGNRIEVVIDGLVAQNDNPGLRATYRKKICEALGISNRYSMLLKNIAQPSVSELVTIAQVLGVTTDELIQYQP